MKNILFKSLAVVTLMGALSSCNDFLEQTSPSSMDSEKIFSSQEFAEGAIANIYNEFGQQTTVHVAYGTVIIQISNCLTVQTKVTEKQTWQPIMPIPPTTR